MIRIDSVLAIACLCGMAGAAAGQVAPEADPQTFEVVSIRKAPPMDMVSASEGLVAPRSITIRTGGRFEARGQTAADLARLAYGFEHLPPGQGVLDVPSGWLTQDRFDVTATAGREWSTPLDVRTVPPELRAMLRTLLDETFELRARIETRDVSVFAVRMSNRDGTLGPGIRPSTDVCPGLADARGREPAPPACILRIQPYRLAATGVTMTDAAQILSRFRDLGVPRGIVVDQTGLDGRYDLVLSLTYGLAPDPFLSLGAVGPQPMDRERLSIARRERALPDALKTQLGLEMRQTKVPMPTLRIERARRFREP